MKDPLDTQTIDMFDQEGETMSKYLEALVIKWAEDKGIMKHADKLSQFSKTQEEVEELYEAIANNDVDEAKDAIGDVIVTLIIQAEMWNLSATDCLAHAYGVISQRTGKMENGVFVKDE
jgi:NTP pyrophosphatase (non-canonical NTP hydrolase)